MALRVELGESLPVGRVAEGELVIIPITGGTFEGPRLRGRVLPGGANWNTRLSRETSRASARYRLQTDDGAVISVFNEGRLSTGDEPGRFSHDARLLVRPGRPLRVPDRRRICGHPAEPGGTGGGGRGVAACIVGAAPMSRFC